MCWQITYSNGGVYHGEVLDGKRHGQGKCTNADGEVYEGQWKEGKRHGQGKYTYADGTVKEGLWHQGEFVKGGEPVTDQGPDADWVADQSADASAPGKRKATGIKKKAKKRKGGYTDKGRLAFKSEGGVLATGHAHTCIPDALFVLLSTLLTTPPDLETVRTAIMGGDLYKDALFTTAQAYIESLGRLSPTSPPLHRLPCVTKEFLLKGGPAYHLLNTTGRLFLVHLLVSYGPDDKEPDDHCVAYDGLTVRDNGQYKKVKELDDGDRSSPEKARDVFDSLYKGMMVRIKNVYELL